MPDRPHRTIALAVLLLLTWTATARPAPPPPIAATPDSAWLRLTLAPERLTGLARLWYPADEGPGEARLLLGAAYTISAVRVDGQPAVWRETAAPGDSSDRDLAPATWRAARALRVTLPTPAVPRPSVRVVEIAYDGAHQPLAPWSFLLRPGDLFHPLVPGTSLAWRVELPGIDAATVAGNLVTVDAGYRTPRPVAALYLLGALHPLEWRAVGETQLACLAPPGETTPPATWDRLTRLLERARGDWGPYPWPTLVIVPDPARGDRPRAYPGVIETGPVAEGVAGDAALLHEILHGWFGLGVATPPRGDWSEGLCALLADHDLRAADRPGAAALFRRGLLRRFTALAGTPADVPLRDYAPGDTATDVVGYGKGLFFFLELRRELGEARFVEGLRRLQSRHGGGQADWSDLFRCFPADASGDLVFFFTAWLDRPGGPRLVADNATYDRARHEVRVNICQLATATGLRLGPPPAPWPLHVRLRLDGLSSAPVMVALDRAERTCRLPAAVTPTAVTVDPFWETFRLLEDPDPPRAPLGGRSGR
jgi:hypothetical protein